MVARGDPVLAADGAVTLLERLSPALEPVDSSSGAIGTAVNRAIAELVPIIAGAPADPERRETWLERLWAAHEADEIPYIERLADDWGELCASKDVASRQFSELRDPEPSLGMPAFWVSAAVLTQAAVLARELERIDHANGEWTRFRRGLQVLFDGTRALNGGNRLHQFVRALEGLVKPEISRTKRQFVHRVQTFARPGQDTQLALQQIFDIRSHVEHLHSPLDALAGSNEERIELANQRTRQADVLARFAFAQVLGSGPLREVFRTDQSIDDFWARPDGERRATWGVPLELVHIV